MENIKERTLEALKNLVTSKIHIFKRIRNLSHPNNPGPSQAL